MTSFFEIGRVVWYRLYFGSALTQVIPARVVAHDGDGLYTWFAPGAPVWRLVSDDGRALRDVPRGEWPEVARPSTWTGEGVLARSVPGEDFAVWWFWRVEGGRRVFQDWYVNLERHAFWSDGGLAGVDVVDEELDGVFAADRTWTWKDEESFATKTGHPAFWTAARAAAVRAEGERVRALAEAGAAPFDGTWCDFAPDPVWPAPELPGAGWDRPPALSLVDADPPVVGEPRAMR